MGNTFVFQSALREEMRPYAKLSLAAVRKLSSRFDTLQSGFGFGIDRATFAALFRLKAEDPATLTLWQCWDTDKNGVTDVLEILSSLTLISSGTFNAKLDACYDLFDFDSNGVLQLEEVRICMRTCVAGLCKLLGMEEPPAADVDRVASRSFGPASMFSGGGGVSRAAFLHFVVNTPAAIGIISRFGTTDAEAVKRKYAVYAAENKAASKIQSAFRLSRANTTAGSSTAAAPSLHRPSQLASSGFVWSLPAVLRTKALFDSMDRDGSGSVSIREMVTSMAGAGQSEFIADAVAAFQALDGSGTLSFAEMLRVCYPQAKSRDVEQMLREVAAATRPPPVADRATVHALRAWFESHDEDFDGRIRLDACLKMIAQQPNLAHLVATQLGADEHANSAAEATAHAANGKHAKSGSSDPTRLVSLAELLVHLFGSSSSSPASQGRSGHSSDGSSRSAAAQAKKMEKILDWAREEHSATAAVAPSALDLAYDRAVVAAAAATAAAAAAPAPSIELDASQRRELSKLWALFDPDPSDGSVALTELQSHFAASKQKGLATLFAAFQKQHALTARVSAAQFEHFYKQSMAATAGGSTAQAKTSDAINFDDEYR